jgi:hypothetical protein
MGLNAAAYLTGSSTYVKKEALMAGPQKFVISGVEAATTPDDKPILQLIFTNGQKFSLNKTNCSEIAAICGDDCDGWLGKSVVLAHDPTVMYAGKRIGGVKLRVSDTPKQKGLQASAADGVDADSPF